MSGPLARGGYRALLLHNRSFRRLYLAQIISLGGDWFVMVPLLGLVLQLTDSALMVSVVLTAQRLTSFLVAPLAGVVADRMKRKHVMIAMDVMRTGAAAGLIFVDDLASPVLAIALVAVIGVGLSFYFPASRSALPNLVDPADLPAANVLFNSAWGMMSAIGAALGGVVAAGFGRDAAFLVDAASFAVSALLVSGIRGNFEGARAGLQPRMIRAMIEGVRYARTSRAVLSLLSAKAGYMLLSGGAVTLYPILSEIEFDSGDFGTGILFAAQGVGALVGPVVIERMLGGRDARIIGFVGLGIVLWSATFVAVAFTPTLLLTAIAVGLSRIGGGANWTFTSHGLQRLSADVYRGRIFSFDFGLTTLFMSISFVVYGWALDAFSMAAVIWTAVVAAAVFGIVWHIVTRPLWTEKAVALAIADAEEGA